MNPVYGQNHFHCPDCNQYEFPEPCETENIVAIGKTTGFQCPKCPQSLVVGLFNEQIQVCFCENCKGFVIDSESLGNLVTRLRSDYAGRDDIPTPIDPSQMDHRELCPACVEPMDVHPYYGPGSIVIDTCMRCQLAWLDHGELGRIVRAPGLRGGAKASSY
jgi:Zn-finger nucleic acid-binding protein